MIMLSSSVEPGKHVSTPGQTQMLSIMPPVAATINTQNNNNKDVTNEDGNDGKNNNMNDLLDNSRMRVDNKKVGTLLYLH